MKKLGKSNSTTRMLLGPYSVWAAIFIIVPLIFIAYYAFTDNNFNFTLENITKFFTAMAILMFFALPNQARFTAL